MGKQIKRIVLEPTEDGSRFTARVETDEDTAGHSASTGRLEIEAIEDDGDEKPTYRVSIDGEDVEGHAIYARSDRRLKIAVVPVAW